MGVKLFVGGLSFTTSNDSLRGAFARYGMVQSAMVMTDRETQRSRGFGFVEMGTQDEADRAIAGMNGANLDVANPRCHQAVDPAIAHAATDAMRCPVGDQSAFGQCDGATAPDVRGVVGKPVAGKTGTTDGDQTAALIAMTKQLAVAGIVADPDWAFSTQLRHDLGGRDPHSEVVNLAVMYTLRDAVAGKPWVNFAAPPVPLAFGAAGRPQPPGASRSPTTKPTKRR